MPPFSEATCHRSPQGGVGHHSREPQARSPKQRVETLKVPDQRGVAALGCLGLVWIDLYAKAELHRPVRQQGAIAGRDVQHRAAGTVAEHLLAETGEIGWTEELLQPCRLAVDAGAEHGGRGGHGLLGDRACAEALTLLSHLAPFRQVGVAPGLPSLFVMWLGHRGGLGAIQHAKSPQPHGRPAPGKPESASLCGQGHPAPARWSSWA
jgi:hypothetical protein